MLIQKHFIGRIFAVRDLGDAITTLLRTLARETSQAEVVIRERGLAGDEAERMRRWYGDAPAYHGPGVAVDVDGYWRAGLVVGSLVRSVTAETAFIGSDDLDRARVGNAISMRHREEEVRGFCKALPSEIAGHPDLAPFSSHTVFAIEHAVASDDGEVPAYPDFLDVDLGA